MRASPELAARYDTLEEIIAARIGANPDDIVIDDGQPPADMTILK